MRNRAVPSSALWVVVVVAVALVVPSTAPPVLHPDNNSKEETLQDLEQKIDVEYNTYLTQVVQLLEKDPKFRRSLENASMEDIKSGKISEDLHFVDRRIRSQLDELKRIELERLQDLARRNYEMSHPDQYPRGFPKPAHLDIRNPHTFEVKDLKKLMKQTTKELEELDRRRREEFKQYEMRKEHNRRESLKSMDEEHRQRAQHEYEEQVRKHRDHPKLHHPGSKQQLEEVWKEEDHMDAQNFDPVTFFEMHDLNGDKHWSEEEVEALFRAELEKMYQKGAPEDDMEERVEEMKRMREHVINETDVNKDGLISYDEFLDMTHKQDFNQDPGWQGLDENPAYNDQDLIEYERHLREQNMIPQDGRPHYPPGGGPMGYDPGYQGSPQHQQQFQQGVPQQQYHPQQGIPPEHQQYHPQQGMPPQQAPYQQQQYRGAPNLQQDYHQEIPQQQQYRPQPPQQQQQYQQQQYQGAPPPQYQQYQGAPPPQQQQYQGAPPPQQQQQQQPLPPAAPQHPVGVAPPSLGGTASREPQHTVTNGQAKVEAASVPAVNSAPAPVGGQDAASNALPVAAVPPQST